MGRRWTAEDIANLKKLAQQHPLPLIAEKMDGSVGAVVFNFRSMDTNFRSSRCAVRIIMWGTTSFRD
jgi:hypothetical protein